MLPRLSKSLLYRGSTVIMVTSHIRWGWLRELEDGALAISDRQYSKAFRVDLNDLCHLLTLCFSWALAGDLETKTSRKLSPAWSRPGNPWSSTWHRTPGPGRRRSKRTAAARSYFRPISRSGGELTALSTMSCKKQVYDNLTSPVCPRTWTLIRGRLRAFLMQLKHAMKTKCMRSQRHKLQGGERKWRDAGTPLELRNEPPLAGDWRALTRKPPSPVCRHDPVKEPYTLRPQQFRHTPIAALNIWTWFLSLQRMKPPICGSIPCASEWRSVRQAGGAIGSLVATPRKLLVISLWKKGR